MSEPRKLKAIEQFGARYVRQYLADARSRHDIIASDPLEALAFFYSKAFNRERRDTIPTAFRNLALGVLRTYTSLEDLAHLHLVSTCGTARNFSRTLDDL
jgi:hypothetical protein